MLNGCCKGIPDTLDPDNFVSSLFQYVSGAREAAKMIAMFIVKELSAAGTCILI